jgi:hypothetical protein
MGLPIGSWLLFPSFTSDIVFNDNVYATSTRRVSAFGLRFRPKIEAILDDGLHKIDFAFSADAQTYPGADSSKAAYLYGGYQVQPSYLTGNADLMHQWRPLEDLTVETIGSFRRAGGASSLLYGDLGGSNGGSIFSAVNPNLPYAFYSGLQYYNRYSGGVSVEKKIESLWSIRAAIGVQARIYDYLPANNYFQNSTSYYATLRGGYLVTPLLRAYAEVGPARNIFNYMPANSNGYHIVGGLESDMIGLFKGDVHAGYQSLTRPNAGLVNGSGSFSSPNFGGNVHYYPLPYLDVSVGFQQSIGWGAPPSTLVSAPLNVASRNRTWQALAEAKYNLFPDWSAYIRGAYGETLWSGGFSAPPIQVKNVMLNLGFSYDFWRNASLTLEYQFTKAIGCLALCNGANTSAFGNQLLNAQANYGSGFSQNQIFAGVAYHY